MANAIANGAFPIMAGLYTGKVFSQMPGAIKNDFSYYLQKDLEIYTKFAAERTSPERFGIKYSLEDEFYVLKQLYRVAPRNTVRPRDLIRSSTGEVIAYTMDLVRGKTVQELIESGSPLPKGINATVRKIIERYHRAGLAHGDIHPNNVMVTETGKVIIIDPVGYRFITEEMIEFDKLLLDRYFPK